MARSALLGPLKGELKKSTVGCSEGTDSASEKVIPGFHQIPTTVTPKRMAPSLCFGFGALDFCKTRKQREIHEDLELQNREMKSVCHRRFFFFIDIFSLF